MIYGGFNNNSGNNFLPAPVSTNPYPTNPLWAGEKPFATPFIPQNPTGPFPNMVGGQGGIYAPNNSIALTPSAGPLGNSGASPTALGGTSAGKGGSTPYQPQPQVSPYNLGNSNPMQFSVSPMSTGRGKG